MTDTSSQTSLEGRLLFAVPKKGRLQQPILSLLEGSDIQFRRETRLDIALVKNLPLALIFLPAADIPTFVGEGRVDLGITGGDQVAEHDAILAMNRSTGDEMAENEGVEQILDLGFGNCKLQVQVPEKGEVSLVEGLVGTNIVTSFVGLTQQYFQKIEEKQGRGGEEQKKEKGGAMVNGDSVAEPIAMGMAKHKLRTRIKYVGGSVEAACALGVADGIVDLVGMPSSSSSSPKGVSHRSEGSKDGEPLSVALLISRSLMKIYVESGETMKAAGLKAIDTVLNSTAVLIKSKRPSRPDLVDLIANRIRGVITAQKYTFCQYNVPRQLLARATSITPGKRAPTVTALEDKDWVAVSVMVEKARIADTMDQLTMEGATDILCLGISNSRGC
ncbi:MAG: hypothetical protein Q9163_003857 [Psora crenata]